MEEATDEHSIAPPLSDNLEQLPVTADNLLGDIQRLVGRCKDLLQELCIYDKEATRHLASFNIWAAAVGAFRLGHQSLAARLKDIPDISSLTERLLEGLSRNLERQLDCTICLDEDSERSTDTDSSSDRSEIPDWLIREPIEGGKDEPSTTGNWQSIEKNITTLRQLGVGLYRSAARHRQQRVDRFIRLPNNEQIHKLTEHYATERAIHAFPRAYEWLHRRAGESIALRRSRFMYLERHKIKQLALCRDTGDDSRNRNQYKEVNVDRAATQAGNTGEKFQEPVIRQSRTAESVAQRTQLSQTVATKFEAERRPESVVSVEISVAKLPQAPAIDEASMSFDCPYCLLTCPATEVSTEEQWRNHLIHDLAPYFCVYRSCKDPFSYTGSYTAWREHLVSAHSEPAWHCLYCEPGATPSQRFPSQLLLESHLNEKHGEAMTDLGRSTVVKHSRLDRPCLTDCPFCGGYPERIEQNYPLRESDGAVTELTKHIRKHLVETALILLPPRYESNNKDEEDDMNSGADRGDDNYKNIEGLDTLYGQWTATKLQCKRLGCDCKKPPSFDSGDWSQFPDTVQLRSTTSICDEFEDPAFRIYASRISAFTTVSSSDEWGFWSSISLGPNRTGTGPEKPALLNDSKLRDYFGAKVFGAAKLRFEASSSEAPSRSQWRPTQYVEDIRDMTIPEAVRALTTYRMVRLEKSQGDREGSADYKEVQPWERVKVVTRKSLSQDDIKVSLGLVTSRERETLEARKAALPVTMQTQMDRVTERIKSGERDGRFEWQLAQFDVNFRRVSNPQGTRTQTHKEQQRGRARTKNAFERVSVDLYYRRSPKQMLNDVILDLYKELKIGPGGEAVAFSRSRDAADAIARAQQPHSQHQQQFFGEHQVEQKGHTPHRPRPQQAAAHQSFPVQGSNQPDDSFQHDFFQDDFFLSETDNHAYQDEETAFIPLTSQALAAYESSENWSDESISSTKAVYSSKRRTRQ